MYEIPEDMQSLQALLERSIERAGAFLRESFEMPAHSLSARQLVHLWQGLQTVAFATTTKKGHFQTLRIYRLQRHLIPVCDA